MQISRGKIIGPQKVVIYGPEGIGKSTFAAQFPNPVFIDTEGSTKKLDVARTPKPSSWTMLLEQVKYFKANPHLLGTLVIDTADWGEQLCSSDICAKAQKSGIEDFGYGKGYVYLTEEFGRLLNLLEELTELGINVVFTAHAQMRKFEQPDEMGAYDRWELKLQKKTGPMLKEWADMVLFANYKTYVVKTDDKKNKAQGGKRVMYTSHHPCWDAKNRDNLGEELPFDFKAIQHCIFVQNGAIQSSKPIVNEAPPATPPKVEPPQSAPAKVEPPKVEPPKAEPPKVEVPSKSEPAQEDLAGIPKPLLQLMMANQVAPWEIQKAVASRGYYPENTPIENYDSNFVSGVLVGAWQQVFQMIKDAREPF
jgi:hypothetical protein